MAENAEKLILPSIEGRLSVKSPVHIEILEFAPNGRSVKFRASYATERPADEIWLMVGDSVDITLVTDFSLP